MLKVFDAVHGLENSLLSDPKNDLPGYLSVLKRLEEALKFLGDNCGLAIQWLEDIVEYLEDNLVADQNLKKSLNDLRELQNGEGSGRLDGGLLDAALDKLESEFRRLLTQHSVPLLMSTPPALGDQLCIAPSPLPVAVIHKLHAILVMMIANKRHEKCISIYIKATATVTTSMTKSSGYDERGQREVRRPRAADSARGGGDEERSGGFDEI
ncbi:hypothetical protein LWI28_014082 [Acer negundo]|uniref:Uncharacterized protein n=1 Tax=Acer negundo TaxID=4023 RepID=A0AAD5IE34_ACENE|nr:hypothetical protein LWI28_014082 [Acer negundo]